MIAAATPARSTAGAVRPAGLPDAARIEVPLLTELRHSGGSDELRYLSLRLLRYFPGLFLALDPLSGPEAQEELRRRFQGVVRRAARRLHQRGEVLRVGRAYHLTEAGLARAQAEALRPDPLSPQQPPKDSLDHRHKEAQQALVWLGGLLGLHAQAEFDGYDVVWRERRGAPRLSHVFEVQVRGSVDSALTRLKRAHEGSRSRLFLVVADERSARFAAVRLRDAFPELDGLLYLLGLGELQRLVADLTPHQGLLAQLRGGG